LTKEKVFTECL